MAARAYWKGFLRLSLVSIPVEIYNPEEIDAVKVESKKTIDLVKFVDSADIDPRYFERPYFIAPADKHAGEGYVVIREALKKTGKIGLAQLTIAGREWLVA